MPSKQHIAPGLNASEKTPRINAIKWLCLWLMLVSPWLIHSANADIHLQNYWTIGEYFNTFPNQRDKAETFGLRVQREPNRLINNKTPVNILVICPGIQTSDYWRRNIQAFELRLKRLGIRYNLEKHFTKPGIDLIEETNLLKQRLTDDTDYLIFTLDAFKHQTLIEQVMAESQAKVILQNITTPLRTFGRRQPLLYVGFDHITGTQLLIKEYQRRFPSGANYAMLLGTQGYVSRMRGGIFERFMTPAAGFTLKDSYYVNFNRITAKEATLQLIKDHHHQDSKLDFIYAASTDIALGALDALSEIGLEHEITINGWGGGSSELNKLKNKTLDFTVMRMNDDSGIAMAEAIGMDLSGYTEQIPTIYSGSFRLLTNNIKPKQLHRFEQRAFRYSNHASADN